VHAVAASLSLAQARRIALAAQGFADPRPSGKVDRRHIRKMFDRIALLQIDSVNVLVRSEELPVFARLGPHDRSLVRRMDDDGELFETWAHEASLMPSTMEPMLRYRKARALQGGDSKVWGGLRNLHLERTELVTSVYDEIVARGPVAPSALSGNRGKKREHWGWNWDEAKLGVENLFWTGRIACRRRGPSFEREYDVPERCLPAAVLATPTPNEHDARLELLRRAAKAHGIGTVRCFADYYRQSPKEARPLIDELAASGELVPVTVAGWPAPTWLWHEARVPRRVEARALLSPFDPVVWERTRAEQLFGFRYRIEIYVPKEKRVHGYYVLPFLLGDELVARVDLKADRASSTLLVQSAFGEIGIDEHHVAHELADELHAMAAWLRLDRIVVRPVGDLARELTAAVDR
jgi:uncharacterized protein